MVAPAVGVFGGTFDPIHTGHLRLARALRDELQLDQVRLIPAGNPYHRADPPQADADERLAMVQAALAGETGLIADTREVQRARPAYTVETLAELRDELGPEAPLWLLVGADSFAALQSWRDWPRLLQLAHLAVAARPGFDPATLSPVLRELWQTRQVPDFPNRSPSGTIRPLILPAADISATDVRRRLAHGEPVAHLLPPGVLDYLTRHPLYR